MNFLLSKDILLQKISSIGLQNMVWLTDFDGTLSDFHSDPQAVTVPATLLADLEYINQETGGEFYIVTGRDIVFIDTVFSPFKPAISAEHHCVTRHSDGVAKALVQIPSWEDLESEFNKVCGIAPGVWIEDNKTFSRTIHYRDAQDNANNLEERLVDATQRIITSYNSETGIPFLGMKMGAKAIEIGPKAQDKGKAVEDMLQNGNRIPIFWGDSQADLPAAIEIKKRGGIFVAVGPDTQLKKIADIHFGTPSLARDAIHELCMSAEKKGTLVPQLG